MPESDSEFCLPTTSKDRQSMMSAGDDKQDNQDRDEVKSLTPSR